MNDNRLKRSPLKGGACGARAGQILIVRPSFFFYNWVPMRFLSKICLWILIGLFLIVFPFVSHSTPEYAEQTGRDCKICHVEATGGDLTKAGEDFREDLRIKGKYRPP